MDQPLRNHRFVMENQIQRPQRNAQHDDDVSQRADLNIHRLEIIGTATIRP